jgi:hypothetical protein
MAQVPSQILKPLPETLTSRSQKETKSLVATTVCCAFPVSGRKSRPEFPHLSHF